MIISDIAVLLYAKYAGMCSTLSPIVIAEIGLSLKVEDVKSLQFSALKFKVAKSLQPLKALSSIDVILLGIVITDKEVLLYAKYAGIRCTLSPIFIVEIGQL